MQRGLCRCWSEEAVCNQAANILTDRKWKHHGCEFGSNHFVKRGFRHQDGMEAKMLSRT